MDNTNLETLAIENTLLYPAFDTNITQYHAEVSNETINLNLLAIPEDEQATVEILGTENLQIGDNYIKIVVIASDKITKKEYTVNVTRRNNNEEQQYINKQKENEEKLNKIYNTLGIEVPLMEKSQLNEQTYEATRTKSTIKQKNSNYWNVIIITIIILIIISSIIIKLIYKKSNKDSQNRK